MFGRRPDGASSICVHNKVTSSRTPEKDEESNIKYVFDFITVVE